MTDIEKLKELEARLRTYALAEDIFGQERRDLEAAADLLASLASKDEEIEILHDAEARWIARLSVLRMHSGDNGKMMLAEFSTWFEKRWNELLAAETSLASKDAEIERLNKRVMFWQGQAFEADLAAQAIEENTALKAELHGEARDARSNDSIAGAWKAECEKQRERADKFMWQVRDTCARAEAAESRLTTALAALGEAREALEPFSDADEYLEAETSGFVDDDPLTLTYRNEEDCATDIGTVLSFGRFRKARATLAKLNALERK